MNITRCFTGMLAAAFMAACTPAGALSAADPPISYRSFASTHGVLHPNSSHTDTPRVQVPKKWKPADLAGDPRPKCPEGVNCAAGFYMYDYDNNGYIDPSAADFTGPNGKPDGVLDANWVLYNDVPTWFLDLNQNAVVDAMAWDFSGNGVVDSKLFDANEDNFWDGDPQIDWSQFAKVRRPGHGEMIIIQNPDGSTDLIIGSAGPLTPGEQIEAGQVHDPCYKFHWTAVPRQCTTRP